VETVSLRSEKLVIALKIYYGLKRSFQIINVYGVHIYAIVLFQLLPPSGLGALLHPRRHIKCLLITKFVNPTSLVIADLVNPTSLVI
jgi:hypothetical protein